tara:strand:+ start:886 stop:1110 length:225 start_codon:yes stop_codon:yes gene_type:complete
MGVFLCFFKESSSLINLKKSLGFKKTNRKIIYFNNTYIDDLTLNVELSNSNLNNHFVGVGSALTTAKLLKNIKK